MFANQMDAGASQSSIMVGTQSLQSTEKQNQSNSFFRKLSIDMPQNAARQLFEIKRRNECNGSILRRIGFSNFYKSLR